MSIFQVFTKDCKPDNDKIVLRAEQNEAIELAEKAFAEKNFSTKKTYLKFLWNAKMRFGKTLCALQLAKKMGFKRTLIVTHRPVVDQGWEEDFHKTFEDCSAQYRYGRKSNDYAEGNFYDLEKFVKEHKCYVFKRGYYSSYQAGILLEDARKIVENSDFNYFDLDNVRFDSFNDVYECRREENIDNYPVYYYD